ncbi:MAG: hypothetical protein J0H39_13850 [Alphaproteobacteria bacterium]|nr:hypothetical protein [Alphaproteobacteria bacterium]
MRKIALATALLLAACQTATPQRNDGPVTVDGLTFRMESPQRRAYERILNETRGCEERNRPLFKARSEAELTSVCRCIDREFADRLPEEFIRRHANELLGRPEPITARERSNLIARATSATADAYEACGWRYP